MTTLSLEGNWLLFVIPQGDSELLSPDQLDQAGLSAIPACVPGNVELDLQRAGLLPDPFFASNIRKLRQLENDSWWYRRRMHIPDNFALQPCELVFEGLDTFATVWVNGIWVGESASMLIEQVFDVTHALHPGEENTFTVRLASAMQEARKYSYDMGQMSWEHRMEGLYIRKAAHMWGWDIMPRAVSAGIWRPVYLQTRSQYAIEQLYIWTVQANLDESTLGIRFQLQIPEPVLEGITLQVHGVCQDHEFTYAWPVEFIADGFYIPIQQPRLWWPKGYGEPNLYTLTLQVRKNDRVLAEHIEEIGIRKLRVDRTEVAGQAWTPEPLSSGAGRIDISPAPASHFVITVNEEPIMVKGTNWVPLDAFHSRDRERLSKALELVNDLGCNMIRCWGGNVYENETFFDWCDGHGVLIWQDFAFACCIYPQSESFLEQVRHEVELVVKRLRNHACLALWCGDNEIDMVYLSEGRDPQKNRLTREIIPHVLENHDPHRHFIPSSPYTPSSVTSLPDAWQRTPEQHLWGPRGYYKSPFYTHHSAHLIGEIGYHGCPDVTSLRRFLSPEHLWPWQENEEWQLHSVYHWSHTAIERDRIQLMANQVNELFGMIPEDLETFALASQVTQAEAKKFFIESTRLRKWSTSGILWWNLIDGWPQFSDAVVDYYFAKKLAYEYIRRVQQGVCVIIGEAGTGKYLPVVVSNDSRAEARISFLVWEADSGETILQDTFKIPANQNWQAGKIRTYASQQCLYLIEWEHNGEKFGNHYLAGTPPFSLRGYINWLSAIAGLPRAFDPQAIAR